MNIKRLNRKLERIVEAKWSSFADHSLPNGDRDDFEEKPQGKTIPLESLEKQISEILAQEIKLHINTEGFIESDDILDYAGIFKNTLKSLKLRSYFAGKVQDNGDIYYGPFWLNYKLQEGGSNAITAIQGVWLHDGKWIVKPVGAKIEWEDDDED